MGKYIVKRVLLMFLTLFIIMTTVLIGKQLVDLFK